MDGNIEKKNKNNDWNRKNLSNCCFNLCIICLSNLFKDGLYWPHMVAR